MCGLQITLQISNYAGREVCFRAVSQKRLSLLVVLTGTKVVETLLFSDCRGTESLQMALTLKQQIPRRYCSLNWRRFTLTGDIFYSPHLFANSE